MARVESSVMRYYYDLEHEQFLGDAHRRHPFMSSPRDPRARWYDFRSEPELIEKVLEDFVPHAHRPAVQRYYQLLRWMNGDGCCFETIDSWFREDLTRAPAEFKANCFRYGRMAFIFRDLKRNVSWADTTTVLRLIEVEARKIGDDTANGLLSYCRWPRYFPALEDNKDGNRGFAVAVQFGAAGASEDEVFDTLDATIQHLEAILRSTAAACVETS